MKKDICWRTIFDQNKRIVHSQETMCLFILVSVSPRVPVTQNQFECALTKTILRIKSQIWTKKVAITIQRMSKFQETTHSLLATHHTKHELINLRSPHKPRCWFICAFLSTESLPPSFSWALFSWLCVSSRDLQEKPYSKWCICDTNLLRYGSRLLIESILHKYCPQLLKITSTLRLANKQLPRFSCL